MPRPSRRSPRAPSATSSVVPPARRQRVLRGAGADGTAVLVPLPADRGQGNLGSSDDPKSFAAMRYTESKLTPIAEVLLGELGQGTTDWAPNFDGTLRNRPGCRRGSRTCCSTAPPASPWAWPPTCRRTINEIVSALLHLLDNPDATVRDLCEHVQGPDYPSSAEIITAANDLRNIYETGNGSVRARDLHQGSQQHRDHGAAVPGVAVEGDRADRRADARQEAAVAGGHP